MSIAMEARESKKSKKTSENTIEYAVYIHLPANQNSQFWERASMTTDPELALEQAHMLFESAKYPKVEIMQKFFCARRKRAVYETFKVFDVASGSAFWIFRAALALWNKRNL